MHYDENVDHGAHLRTPPRKFPRALRWAGAFILTGVGFFIALLVTDAVYTHIYVQGARACERWYEGETDWNQTDPEETI